MKTSKVVYLSVIIGFAPLATADDLYLDINGFSKHSSEYYSYQGEKNKYNSVNPGLGITMNIAKYADVFAGFYDNSYYQTSVYAGVNLKVPFTISEIGIAPGVAVGGISGYEDTPLETQKISALVLPNLVFSYRNAGIRISYVPKVKTSEDRNAVSVWLLQLQYRIKP